MMPDSLVTAADLDVIAIQLGRPARGVRAVAARCSDNWPAVVETEPRLADGTPFPTYWYLTCRRLSSAISTLEAEGVMRGMQDRLTVDPELAERYRQAHLSYLRVREAVLEVPEIADTSAGGMPTRVKCLHSLVGHSLAVGPGVNPIGDQALAILVERGMWPHPSPCVASGGKLPEQFAVAIQSSSKPTPRINPGAF